MAQDDPVVRQGRSFSVIQRSGDGYRTVPVFSRRGVNIYVETVGEAVSDVERLCKSRIILDRDGIDHLRIDCRIDSRSVVHAEDIGAGLFRKRKIAAFAYGRAVQTERSGVALRDTDTSPKRQGCGTPVDLHSEHLKRIVGAISADRVFFVGVMHIDGIAANAGIDLAVAQDRDIEPGMHVGPDIEIRGVVSSEVNIISQYFRPAHGADQQIRGIRGGILRVLLTLVGNRSDDALHIGQQIAVARGLLSGKSHLRTIRIVVGIIRRCGRHIEHGYRTRYREQLHGAQFDVGNGRSNGNAIGDFRHAALYFDGRQRQHPVCRGNYRYIALIGHR